MDRLDESKFKEVIGTCTFPVVADFSAEWCSPCKVLKKTLEELEPCYVAHAKFVNCDVEECEELCTEYGIVNVPTVLIFKNGERVDGFLGNLSRDKIIEKIEKYV